MHYRGSREKIDQYSQHNTYGPPPPEFAEEPEQERQINGKRLRYIGMPESTMKREPKAFAPHQQHDNQAGAQSQSAQIATRRATRDREQPRDGQKKVHAAISDALSGKEATSDHRAADYEKDPFERRERTERSPQFTKTQQFTADGDADAD